MSSTFFLDRGGCDAVFDVIGVLFFAPAVGFADGAFHRAGDPVGIHDDAAFGVTRGAADGLHQRGFRAQEAFFVRVQNRHETAFGDVQALAQKVDADEHVERPKAQVAQDLDPFNRVDVGVHVAHADALFVQVFGQVFGHAFGQRRDERAHAHCVHLADFIQHVVDLSARRGGFRRVGRAGRWGG